MRMHFGRRITHIKWLFSTLIKCIEDESYIDCYHFFNGVYIECEPPFNFGVLIKKLAHFFPKIKMDYCITKIAAISDFYAPDSEFLPFRKGQLFYALSADYESGTFFVFF